MQVKCDLQRSILTWQTSLDIQTTALTTHYTINMQKTDLLYLLLLENMVCCSNLARSGAAHVQLASDPSRLAEIW